MPYCSMGERGDGGKQIWTLDALVFGVKRAPISHLTFQQVSASQHNCSEPIQDSVLYRSSCSRPAPARRRALRECMAGLHVALPRRGEVRPAQLVERPHSRGRAGVQHQDLGADVSEDALGGPVVGDVDRDHCDAEPLLHRCERGLAARHDGGPGLGCRRSPRWSPSALLCLVPAEPRTFGAAEKSHRGPRGTAIAAGEARFEPVLVCRLGRTFERKSWRDLPWLRGAAGTQNWGQICPQVPSLCCRTQIPPFWPAEPNLD